MTQIHWSMPVSGNFSTAADWSSGTVPGPGDVAILDAAGAAYTVTADTSQTVASLQTAPTAILSIVDDRSAVMFTASAGTGSGVNAGQIQIGNFNTLAVGGALDNSGVIALDSAGGHTALEFMSNTTLSGGGRITLSDEATNSIFSRRHGTVLTNIDNTLSGGGKIDGALVVANGTAGVIDANGVQPLLLEPRTLVNAGLIEGTGKGGLIVRTLVSNSATGVIFAGPSSHVALVSAVVEGGTLETSGSGVIEVTTFSVIDGTSSVVNNTGYLQIGGQAGKIATVDIYGAINNTGTIGFTNSNFDALNTTFTGGGQINLSNNITNDIFGASQTAVFTNVDNKISGAGLFGSRPGGANRQPLTLVNQVMGVIDANDSAALTIDTLTNTITNAGLIEATGAGGGVIASPIDNTGVLEAEGGSLTVNAPVTGNGSAIVSGGALNLTSAFTQNVTFTGASGVLELGQSQSYAGAISGFSKAGGTSLDLADIGFVGSNEASFSGTTTSGVLTVSDGTHAAHITLIGDYTASIFVAASDGHGGVTIIDPAKSLAVPAHGFIAAMAGFGAGGGMARVTGEARADAWRPMLLAPS